MVASSGIANAGVDSPNPKRDPGYDYLLLDLKRRPGQAGQRGAADHLASAAASLAGRATLVGLFAPQLGWSAHQAAILLRWPDHGSDRQTVTTALVGDVAMVRERHELTPTLRPTGRDAPKPGGIYVHRWFTVRESSLPEFLRLSAQGWSDFEQRFDANIFGLFRAEQTSADRTAGVVRLLLLTRYGSHAVWEASRDPTTAAMKSFARRQALTLDTGAVSTVLVPPPDAPA